MPGASSPLTSSRRRPSTICRTAGTEEARSMRRVMAVSVHPHCTEARANQSSGWAVIIMRNGFDGERFGGQPGAERPKQASRIAVLTGAGISAESGIPTFRGPGGIWRTYRAEDLATPEAFARDPKFVWEWYDFRRSAIAEVEPNAGHRALAELGAARSEDFTLITQNVDGLHDRAGSRRVLKVHGDIWTLRCTGCGREREEKSARLREIPPRCECGAIERPGVVWFGEALPATRLGAGEACGATSGGAAGGGNVGGGVSGGGPGGGWQNRTARSVVEVIVAETPVTAGADYSLRGPARHDFTGITLHENLLSGRIFGNQRRHDGGRSAGCGSSGRGAAGGPARAGHRSQVCRARRRSAAASPHRSSA